MFAQDLDLGVGGYDGIERRIQPDDLEWSRNGYCAWTAEASKIPMTSLSIRLY